jgi:signal transduction histidine kinase
MTGSARPGGDRGTAVVRPPLTYRITARQWLAVDAAAAAATLVVMMFGLRLTHAPRLLMPTPDVAAAIVAASLPVAVRRLWPLPVLAVVTVAVSFLTAMGRAPLTSDVMIGMASYMAATRLRRTAAVAALVAVEGAILAGLLTAAATAHAQQVMLHSMLAVAAMWFVGAGVRERRTYQAGLAGQAAQQRRAEADRNRHAVQQERLRIARELHDVLAHTLSVVTVQAGVGRRVGAGRPAEALRALAAVEEASRGALDELRRALCLLRDEPASTTGQDASGMGAVRPGADGQDAWDAGTGDGTGAALSPAPGLGDLEALAAMVRTAGTPVRLDVTGNVPAVPPAAALTAYRIVQEALTNVVRHAPGARAAATVEIGAAGIRIRVTDTGGVSPGPGVPGLPDSGDPPSELPGPAGSRAGLSGTANGTRRPGGGRYAAGHGIMGMRERAAVFGGTLDAAPLPRGGFQVTAFLPVPAIATGRVA